MKRLILFALAMIAMSPSSAQALSFTDAVVWSPPLEIADAVSGNAPVFTFRHALPSWPEVREAGLEFTHSGNADEGPTREIWTLEETDSPFSFRLGASDREPYTDHIPLTASIVDALLRGKTTITFTLTERTPYNGEKLTLLGSRLWMERKSLPMAPEPSGAALGLLAALAGLVPGHKKRPAA